MAFVPDLPVLLAFSLASILLVITPGPDMTLFVGRALSDGKAAGMACIAGALTGIGIHTVLVALGISALVVASPTAFLILKTGGAAYLFWMAVQAIRFGSTFRMAGGNGHGHSLFRQWLHGLSVNLLNPKIIIFFMTFLPQFVSASDPHITGKLIFLGLTYDAITLPICVGMVLVADGLALWLKANRRVTRALDYLFAGVFSLFAVRILLTEGR